MIQSASEDELKKMNVSEFLENPDATATIYDHPSYIKELLKLLPSLLVDGYLD